MVQNLIKQFKNFLQQQGANTPFMGFYRDYHYEENPENFEEYLKQIEAPFVIVNAFDFNRILLNKTFNKKYWYRLHAMWNRILVLTSKNRERIANEAGISKEDVKECKNTSWFDGLLSISQPTTPSTYLKTDEIRFIAYNSNLIFNNEISTLAEKINARMSVKADSDTSELVLVFSPNEDMNVRKYTIDKRCVTKKHIKTYLECYFGIKIDENSDLLLYITPPRWNADNTAFAVIVKKDYKKLS